MLTGRNRLQSQHSLPLSSPKSTLQSQPETFKPLLTSLYPSSQHDSYHRPQPLLSYNNNKQNYGLKDCNSSTLNWNLNTEMGMISQKVESTIKGLREADMEKTVADLGYKLEKLIFQVERHEIRLNTGPTNVGNCSPFLGMSQSITSINSLQNQLKVEKLSTDLAHLKQQLNECTNNVNRHLKQFSGEVKAHINQMLIHNNTNTKDAHKTSVSQHPNWHQLKQALLSQLFKEVETKIGNSCQVLIEQSQQAKQSQQSQQIQQANISHPTNQSSQGQQCHIYLIDPDGYLLDNCRRYLTIDSNQRLKLTKQQLTLLHQHHILKHA